MAWEDLYTYLDFSIDTYLNPYLLRNHLSLLPSPVSHFLGYRAKPAKEPPIIIQWLLTATASIAGLCTVAAVYNYAPAISKWNPPTIVASLGASAVLDYNTIRSPLSQPRNSILGHTIAAVLGVAIANAFQMDPVFFANYPWLAAAVACAVSSVAMSMTNTVHPPGGATAILACTDKEVLALGWMFPPLMLLASVLMVAVACVINNTLRQYPVFWWTPEETGGKLPWYRKRKGVIGSEDTETGALGKGTLSEAETKSEHDLEHEFSNEVQFLPGLGEVQVAPYALRMPPHFRLSDHEVELLSGLQMRLRNHSEVN